ncbi:MAG: hypothetical protein JW726_13880 [Anaerolineales bacterium]|nr:hypothetical protein [Anaerolineales bacterium]
MPSFFYKTMHPAHYHGHKTKPPFFEGWYFKLVSADESQRYAIIPGVILGEHAHAFVQVLNGVTGETAYHTYPLEQFWASERQFEVRIGLNTFTQERITLDIPQGPLALRGELRFTNTTPWPVSLLSPGIMGWYAWVPFMECYHGVLSFDHPIQGSLAVDRQVLDFSDGRGYIEKDWGKSFPAGWIWMQSNHFSQPSTCLTASIARIPWIGSAFTGFIVGFWHAERLYRFATYTGAQVESLQIAPDHIEWVLRDRHYRIELRAARAEGGLILGPTRMEMGTRVPETLNARLHVRLSELSGGIIFEGEGRHAGLEVVHTEALK